MSNVTPPDDALWPRLLEETKPQDRVLSRDEALNLFDRLANRQDFAFGYPHTGCEARAFLMFMEIIDMGILPRKAWIFEGAAKTKETALHYQPPPVNNTETPKVILWRYHVAPCLNVDLGDGQPQPMVFDPSIFDGPVTPAQWCGVMKGDMARFSIRELPDSPDGYIGDYMPVSQEPHAACFTDSNTAKRVHHVTLSNNAYAMRLRTVYPCGLRKPVHTPSWKTLLSAPKGAQPRQSRR